MARLPKTAGHRCRDMNVAQRSHPWLWPPVSEWWSAPRAALRIRGDRTLLRCRPATARSAGISVTAAVIMIRTINAEVRPSHVT